MKFSRSGRGNNTRNTYCRCFCANAPRIAGECTAARTCSRAFAVAPRPAHLVHQDLWNLNELRANQEHDARALHEQQLLARVQRLRVRHAPHAARDVAHDILHGGMRYTHARASARAQHGNEPARPSTRARTPAASIDAASRLASGAAPPLRTRPRENHATHANHAASHQ